MVFLSRAAEARDGQSDEVRAAGGRDEVGEEPLHVASRLHAFNRFELKYLVPVEQAAEIRDELAGQDVAGGRCERGVGVAQPEQQLTRTTLPRSTGRHSPRRLGANGERASAIDCPPACVSATGT